MIVIRFKLSVEHVESGYRSLSKLFYFIKNPIFFSQMSLISIKIDLFVFVHQNLNFFLTVSWHWWDVLILTDVFLNKKRVNVSEHAVKMTSHDVMSSLLCVCNNSRPSVWESKGFIIFSGLFYVWFSSGNLFTFPLLLLFLFCH